MCLICREVRLERIIYAVIGILLIWPERVSNYVGIVGFIVITIFVYLSAKKLKKGTVQ